jgi:D-alanyl-D-alanine carboxypeptidase
MVTTFAHDTPRHIKNSNLETYLNHWRKTNNIPGISVAILKPDYSIIVYNSGMKTLKNHDPINNKTLFRIGSITKTFISAMVLKLEAQHKLSIHDHIGKYLPQYPKWATINIQQLLNMTSGIYRYTQDSKFKANKSHYPLKSWSNTQLINIAYKHKNYFKPGTKWHYTNTNYLLLAMIIEKVSGENVSFMIKNHLIKPNNLANTYYITGTLPQKLKNNIAHGYEGNHDVTYNFFDGAPAGGMTSSAKDIALWTKALFTNTLPKNQLAELETTFHYHNSFEPKGSAYGLGIFTLETKRFGKIWWYTGVVNGYSALMIWIPTKHIAISAAINRITQNNYEYLFPQKSLFKRLLKEIA